MHGIRRLMLNSNSGLIGMHSGMKLLLPFALTVVAGCIGDAALPIVSSTPIPDTSFEIILSGPDRKGDFCYYVYSPDWYSLDYVAHINVRSLGPLRQNQRTPASLEDFGDGVFRIQWGDPTAAVYAIVDAENQLLLEDSNGQKKQSEPFMERRIVR